MKILIPSVLIICLAISVVYSVSKTEFKSKHKKSHFMNQKHKQITIDDRTMSNLVRPYAYNDPYILQNHAVYIISYLQQGMVNPLVLERIPLYMKHNLNLGEIEDANTYVPNRFYYDGSENLSAVHVECNVYSTYPEGCMKNSLCGWCGATSTCIPGNASGPLAPCLRNTFLYSMPVREWNPLKAGVVNIFGVDRKGVPSLHLTSAPDLQKINVFDPYK